MSRISIDPDELVALSALVRNASYDVAGIANEVRARVEQLPALVGGPEAMRLTASVDAAVQVLHRVAALLDDDAQAVAVFGQKGAAADALGELAGNEHDLLSRMQQPAPGEPE